MKTKTGWTIVVLLAFIGSQRAFCQDYPSDFPVDPFPVLKTWNYQTVRSNLGSGEQIVDTMFGKPYLAGYRYQQRWLERDGVLEFYFTQKGISIIQFKTEHPLPEPSEELSAQLMQDTLLRKSYNQELVRVDSVRRDSIVKGISKMMGTPNSAGPTPAADRQARYSASWVNHGYACTMRDLGTYTTVVFSLVRTPDWTVNQFGLPNHTEVISKHMVVQQRQSWEASLLGAPTEGSPMLYDHVYLLLEFQTGERYLENLPPLPYPAKMVKLDYNDMDGNAFLDPWIIVELAEGVGRERHYIYSVQLKEPIPIFETESLLPYEIALADNKTLLITFPEGSVHHQKLPLNCQLQEYYTSEGEITVPLAISPDGFHSLVAENRNRDGSLNLSGVIRLLTLDGKPAGEIQILYEFNNGTWRPLKSQFVETE